MFGDAFVNHYLNQSSSGSSVRCLRKCSPVMANPVRNSTMTPIHTRATSPAVNRPETQALSTPNHVLQVHVFQDAFFVYATAGSTVIDLSASFLNLHPGPVKGLTDRPNISGI